MIFNAKNSYLMVYDFTGTHADFMVEKLEPIRLALAVEGGTIHLKAIWLDFRDDYLYMITYRTLCGKIVIKYEMTREAFNHNSDFFGDEFMKYDSPITFSIENDKFRMP